MCTIWGSHIEKCVPLYWHQYKICLQSPETLFAVHRFRSQVVTYKPSPADVKTLLEAGTSVESVAGSTVAVAADEDANFSVGRVASTKAGDGQT